MLARKYRPTGFADLVGQEAMIRILRNAFAQGRIAHAWMLTGVRGVGKTTTARILARALNYEPGGPTVRMPALGVHCQAIMESRHVDVFEMDAASHTSVDDVRQIYLNPDVTSDYDVTPGEPDFAAIVDFLCGEREFSKERVTAALERAFAERSLF